MSDPFAIFRMSNSNAAARGHTAVAAHADDLSFRAVASHTHVTEDICPQCRCKMQVAYGADNLAFYFCAQHGIAQPVPVNGVAS